MQATDTVWTPTDLLARLEQRDKFFVLDVRNRDEFKRFRLEGLEPLPSYNIPYFEMLETGGKEDMIESLVACADTTLNRELPKDVPILTVCAKGGTSEFVAQALRQLGYSCTNLAGGMKQWGDHYTTRPIVESHDLAIYQVSRMARGCLSYVIASKGHAIVLDPLRHVKPYLDLAAAKSFKIEQIIDTHGHADHVSGAPRLAAETGASYHLHPYDAIHPIDMIPGSIMYDAIWDGEVFPVGSHELRAIHSPGHTLGMIAFQLDDKYLFSGDSIFIQSISRPDLGGKAENWAPLHVRSLRKLLGLSGETILLPGHFSSLNEEDNCGHFARTLDQLKSSNESLVTLQRESDEKFIQYLLGSLPRFIPEYVEIKRVNAGLAAPAEEEMETLELGKNVCALAQAYASTGGN